MQLHLSTWQEVEAYLQRSKAIIVPIGSTEQHGPNGLIGTDAICPEVIAKRVGDEGDVLVAPTFNVGCAQHHLAFPGTMSLRPSTMIAAIADWVASLARHGFEKIYFLNGHGGNVATINAAFSEIYAEGSFFSQATNAGGFKLALKNWWEFRDVLTLCNRLYPQGHGSHATPSEVAVTYFAYPDAVKQVQMEPKIAPTGPIRDAADYRRRFPDGRIGSDPSQATVEQGAEIVSVAAKCVTEDFAKFAGEER